MNLAILSKKLKNKNLFLCFLLLIIILCLILNPTKYISVCLNGVLVFGLNLLPAMLPFIFFTKLLTSTGYVENFSKIFSPITQKLYNSPAISSYVFLMSILSGYPLGAKITADLFSQGLITRQEAHRICSFTSNSGPMFIVGTVGVSMLNNPQIAYILLISHIISALLNGLIYRNYTCEEFYIEKIYSQSADQSISACMENSIISVLMIGGYVAIFFVLTEICTSLKLFEPICSVFSIFGIQPEITKSVLNGIFEITNGCKSISALNCSNFIKASLSSFIISFGGLAVAFQGLNFLEVFKVNKKFFFLQKFTHSTISTLITILLCLIFKI